MRVKITAILVAVFAAMATPAVAHHEATPPPALQKITKIQRIYPKLYRQEIASHKVSWNQLRKRALVKWYSTHPYADATIYHYWHTTGDTYGTVQKVFAARKVPAWKVNTYNCIFKHESNFDSDTWYRGNQSYASVQGWQPRFIGTDRVNGVAQLRPFWAWWWLAGRPQVAPRRDASIETYHVTSDPIVSTKIALAIGLQPFYADKAVCGF